MKNAFQLSLTGLFGHVICWLVLAVASVALVIGLWAICLFLFEKSTNLWAKMIGILKGNANIYKFLYYKDSFKAYYSNKMFFDELLSRKEYEDYHAAHPEYYNEDGTEKDQIPHGGKF